VARKVVEQAMAEGVAQSRMDDIPGAVEKAMWQPVYPALKVV
jgi:malic enzyme